MEITVSENQSVFDIAVRYCGSDEAAYAIAILNNISVTETLVPGQKLEMPVAIDADIVDYFEERGINPATTVTDAESLNNEILEGIDYWAIGVDFVVS